MVIIYYQINKWYLFTQNRNRPKDIENKLIATKGKGMGEG